MAWSALPELEMVRRMPVDSIWEAPSTNTTSAMPPAVASVVVRRTYRLSRLYLSRASTRRFLSSLRRASPEPSECVADAQLSHAVNGHCCREHREAQAEGDSEPGDSPMDHD